MKVKVYEIGNDKTMYTSYAPEVDMTYVMVETICGDMMTLECVGWHFGEPRDMDYPLHYSEENKEEHLKAELHL